VNIELIKRLADLRNQFNELQSEFQSEFQKEGVYTIRINGSVQVSTSKLIGKANLEISSRDSEDYPFEISTVVEGIKIYAIANVEDITKFPQFKEQRKVILLQQLAEIEKEGEVTV
jgi:hypothetical protein